MAPKRRLSAVPPASAADDSSDEHQHKRQRDAEDDSDSYESDPCEATAEPPPPQKRRILLPTSTDPTGQRPSGPFNLITALCAHTDILLIVTRYLPPKSLVDLISISGPFHYQFCSHQVSFILASSRNFAPDAELVSPWRFYAPLCTLDPAHRAPTYRVPRAGAAPIDALRRIPSLRWLRMVTYRALVVESILGHLRVAGAAFPRSMALTLLKLWFAMDMPLSTLRLSLFRNEAFINIGDLYRLQLFMIKLDMYFADPICVARGSGTSRKMLLAEWSLTPLWNVLRGRWNRVDALRLWCRHRYNPPRRTRPETKAVQEAWDSLGPEYVCGVPLSLCGRVGTEMWGLGTRKMIRFEQLIVGEAIRRGLKLERYLIRMVRFGYLDLDLRKVVKNTNPEILLPERVWAREIKECREREKEREQREQQASRDKEVAVLMEAQAEDWDDLACLTLEQEDVD